MFEHKKDLFGNVTRFDAAGHSQFVGKVSTAYNGQVCSPVINNYGRSAGTIYNDPNPRMDGAGYTTVNFETGSPTT